MFGISKSQKRQGWVGVTLQGSSARLAHVVCTPGSKPRVAWAASQTVSQPAGLWSALRRQHQLDKHHVVAALPRDSYQILAMETPDVPRADWASAVRWKLKDAVEFPVDNAAIDVLAVPGADPDGPARSVLAVAAQGDKVQSMADLCTDAQVGLEAIDVIETGLRNLCTLTDDQTRAQALLRVGEQDTQLVTTFRGELLQVRHIDTTMDQVTDPDDAIRQTAFDRIALEAQRTLDMCERLFSYANLGMLWVAPGRGAPGLAEYLRDVVYVPVTELALGELMDLSAVPELASPEELGVYAPALGVALRSEMGAA